MFVFSENVCRFAQILNKAFFRESMGVKALKIKLLAVVMLCSFSGFGFEDSTDKKQEEFNPKEMIMHHVKDAYGFHLWDWNGHSIALPLPVLLWVDGEMITFMSSEKGELGCYFVETDEPKHGRSDILLQESFIDEPEVCRRAQ